MYASHGLVCWSCFLSSLDLLATIVVIIPIVVSYVLWYHLLALWRDNYCLEGSGIRSRGPIKLNLWSICWLWPACGYFVAVFGLYVWIRGSRCCFAFRGLEAMCVLLTMMIVLSSYPLWCDCQEYLARFEVSFRVELICCNGPVWLYPVCLF